MASETPEHPVAPAGYESNPFSLIKPSWEGVKLNARAYIAVNLMLMVPGLLLLAGVVIFGFANSLLGLVIFAITLVYGFYAVIKIIPASYRLQLAIARHQKMTLREALQVEPAVGWRIFWVTILAGLAVVGGLLLLVIPGIIFATWFYMSAYVVIEEGLSGTAALRRSRELTRNRFWDALGSMSLLQAPSILGIVPVLGPIAGPILGFIVMPVAAIRYDQLVKLKASSDGKDIPVSAANYAALVLAILATIVSSHNSPKNSALNNTNNQYPGLEQSRQPY
jgi:hypothetical protein